jgi:hypothetical protein
VDGVLYHLISFNPKILAIKTFNLFLLFNKMHGAYRYTISCPFLLPNSFEKKKPTMHCYASRAHFELKISSSYFQKLQNISNKFHSNLTMGIEIPNFPKLNPRPCHHPHHHLTNQLCPSYSIPWLL